MERNLEKTEKSQEEELYDFAIETRKFIEELHNEFFHLGIFKIENDSLERSLKLYGILIDHLTEFEIDPENEYLRSIYDDYSGNMQLLFKGLRDEGLTLKSDLENYNENVYAIARKFGEVNERLRKLQEMFISFDNEKSKDNLNNPNVETNEENKRIRELQATILKFKWTLLFVISLSFASSIAYFSYVGKVQSKLRSENTELKDGIKRAKGDAKHYKRLFQMCTKLNRLSKSGVTKNSTEIDGPKIGPQD